MNPVSRNLFRPAPFSPLRRAALVAGASGLAVALAAGPSAAVAQSGYPTRTVRLVVNFPPGGVADQIARVLARQMQQSLGQPFVVENRAGGNGNIGAGEVVRAAPDGYTLLLAPSGVITVNGLLYRSLGFDPMKDLAPVAAQLAISSYLVVHPKVPSTTLKEFIEHARSNPGKLNYATPGSGSSSHLAAELLKREAGVDGVHVPYKGAAPALNGLLGGEIEYMFDPGTGLPHVKTGRLRLLAVASPTRDPQFPVIPTVGEVIGREFDASTLFGVLAPAGTPRPVIETLDREIARSMQTSEMKQVIERLGANPRYLGPTEYSAQLRRIHETMGVLVRQNGLTAD